MKELIKKWWFWLIVVVIISIIGITTIMVVAFNIAIDDIGELAIQIQDIYDDATIYTSAGNNTLILELNNWSDKETETNKLPKMIDIIKAKVDKGELQSYTKLITLAFITSGNKEESLCIKTVCSLPGFNEEKQKEYIEYSEYQNLYNTLITTSNSYQSIFNNLY